MTELQQSQVHRIEPMRPEDIQEMFGIKKVAYYNRLKFLEMEAQKDEDGKPYLDESQVALLEELDEYMRNNGKMEGFEPSNNGVSLVRTDDNNLTASTNSNGNHSTRRSLISYQLPVISYQYI